MERTAYIYKHTNKVNGKCYIGQTCNIKARWKPKCYEKCTKFYNAIKKYGWDNFTHEILYVCEEKDADYWEEFFIDKYHSVENGYNLDYGGNPNKEVSVETREKLRRINIGRKLSKEIKDKISKSMIKNNCKIRNKTTGEVFDTVRIASQQTGISKSCIYSACKGKIRTAGGFEWEYVN